MWRYDRANLIRTVALLLSAVTFLFLLPSLLQPGGPAPLAMNFVTHGYVLGWLMLLTLPVRSIASREVLTAFFLGMFFVPGFVFLIGVPIRTWLGGDLDTLAIVWAPLLEETALLLAAAIFAIRLARRAAGVPGLADLFVLGFAIGAGYAIHEDALYGRFQPGWHTSFATVFDGAYGWAYPTFSDAPTAFFSYHGAHGALLALALGLVILLRRRTRWIVAVIPAVWIYSVFDHSVANLQVSYGPTWLGVLVANGHAVAVLALIAPLAAVAVDFARQRRSAIALPAPNVWLLVNSIRYSTGPLQIIGRLLLAGGYHRTRNAMINSAWSDPTAPAKDPSLAEAMLVMLMHGLRDRTRDPS